MNRFLELKWSVSRGRDTYGYNICTLIDCATGSRYRCNGGGYDMVGTVFGDWLQQAHQDRLRKISDRAHYQRSQRYESSARCDAANSLYGMTHYSDDGRIVLDGACGIESMLKIAEAAGIKVSAVRGRRLLGWNAEWEDGQ